MHTTDLLEDQGVNDNEHPVPVEIASSTDVILPTRATILLTGDLSSRQYVPASRPTTMSRQSNGLHVNFSHTQINNSIDCGRRIMLTLVQTLLMVLRSASCVRPQIGILLQMFFNDVAEDCSHRERASECIICCENINRCYARGYLPCGHSSFHKKCLSEWTKKARSCPLCRMKV
jgi:Ring finger domain